MVSPQLYVGGYKNYLAGLRAVGVVWFTRRRARPTIPSLTQMLGMMAPDFRQISPLSCYAHTLFQERTL